MIRSTRQQRRFFWVRFILGFLGCAAVNSLASYLLPKSPWRQPLEGLIFLLGMTTLLLIALLPELNRFRSVLNDSDLDEGERRLIICSEAGGQGAMGASDQDLESFMTDGLGNIEIIEKEAVALSGLAKRLSSSWRVHPALPAVCYRLESWLKTNPDSENYWTIRLRFDKAKERALSADAKQWEAKWTEAAKSQVH